MNITLTEEEIKNIIVLISNSQIKGSDAMTVALLVQKLNAALLPKEEVKEEKKK